MNSPRRPWWQQATALVSLGAGGAVTGFAFVPGTADHVASPASIPVTLTALDQAARPAPSDDSALRSAILSVTNYYLRLAQSKTPAEMEALIWQRDSKDGADHGESCAAFASMTLALAAQLVGRQSWVTGGSTYPWPLQDWADVRVDPNPASLGITSVLQDAQAHQRWHAIGDGYQPLPGDWVLFNGHVEVVTKYSGGVLSTVGGDSLPNFSVNAHEYPGPLAAQGVAGFVSNGNLPAAGGSAQASSAAQPATSAPWSAPAATAPPAPASAGQGPAAGRNGSGGAATQADEQAAGSLAAVPGTLAAVSGGSATGPGEGAVIPGVPQTPTATAGGGAASHQAADGPAGSGQASAHRATALEASAPRAAARRDGAAQAAGSAAQNGQTGSQAGPAPVAGTGLQAGESSGQPAQTTTSQSAVLEAAIPGMPGTAATESPGQAPAPAHTRHHVAAAAASTPQPSPSLAASGPGTPAQRAFITQVAPGALAAQRTYGVPAAVTIAQAIEESGWGQSTLAAQDHNLFGIKGSGPAGSVSFPTQEFQNGQWVTISAQFRSYQDIAQSIDDHGKLLATSGYYTAAMAQQQTPDRFAQALTGVYATDPNYGTTLIGLMQNFDLYRYGTSAHPPTGASTAAGPAAPQATPSAQPSATHSATPPASRPRAAAASTPDSPPRTSPRPLTPTTKATPPAAAPSTTVQAPPANPGAAVTPPAAPSTTVTAPAPSTTVSPPSARPSATATGPSLAAPTAAAGPKATASAKATASPSAAASQQRAVTPPAVATTPAAQGAGQGSATPPASPVPHPFATPQPQPSSPGTPPAQAAIPGVPSGPSAATTRTSAELRSPAGPARLRSSSDTEVVAELAAVFHHEPPAAKPAPNWATGTHAEGRTATAEPRPAKRGPAGGPPAQKKAPKRRGTPARARKPAPRYQPQIPAPVKNAFLASARKPLARAEFLYRDVAASCGISWKLLAACDWMQCEAHPRYSPVQGEKLGTVNADGTVFRTKSEALTQCARDLVAVADTVYQIDLTVPIELSVLELARVFAAFRWGGLLKLHNTSAMEFPYSVQGLTEQHTGMRWPRIAEPNVPDKPGAKFRRPFGAVPVVLSLEYPATV